MHPQCARHLGQLVFFLTQVLSDPHETDKAGFSRCPAQEQTRRNEGGGNRSRSRPERQPPTFRRRHPGGVFNSSPVNSPAGLALQFVRVRLGAGLWHLL